MAKASADFRNQVDEAEEFVEVKGGDFPAAHDFDKQDTIVGTFLGTEEKTIKGKDRVLHTVEVDGEPVTLWGTAILDSRLSEVEPNTRVKIVRRGKVPTKSGNQAWDFSVYVARSAFRGQ